jgi:myo-inositol-1(or 4)-monophosphatase
VAISEGIFRDLAAEFPVDQYFSEELADTDAPIPVTTRYSWVLDPIDGTNNFALGISHCAIALALCEQGEPVYGIVYDLSRRTLMHGGPGFGMFDGERATTISTAAPTRETLIGFHSPFDKTLVPMACGVISSFKIRGLGSATLHLAYVAAGLLDGCVDFNVKIWDLAAAIPLVRATGGDVQFLNGEQLPMRTFNLRMGRIVYVAGSTAMCSRLRELMSAESLKLQIPDAG